MKETRLLLTFSIFSSPFIIFYLKNTEVHKPDRKKIYFTLFSLWFLAVHTLMFIPQFSVTKVSVYSVEFRGDYVIHLLTYFVGSILFWLWLKQIKQLKIFHYVVFVLSGALLSFSGELIQRVVPGRVFNMNDFLFNLMGILAGTLTFAVIHHFSRSKS
ncbi:MAG: hypothetical protein C0594_04275 [Marinilabiliales bacterium]|nr:MAG: hypothetical protein C0594_04275 [Marinilabiliales bacterium]